MFKKTVVKAIGSSTLINMRAKKSKVDTSGEKEAEIAKESISNATTGLKGTVQGQFGERVTEILGDQKKCWIFFKKDVENSQKE